MTGAYTSDKNAALEQLQDPQNIDKPSFIKIMEKLEAHFDLDSDQVDSLWDIMNQTEVNITFYLVDLLG